MTNEKDMTQDEFECQLALLRRARSLVDDLESLGHDISTWLEPYHIERAAKRLNSPDRMLSLLYELAWVIEGAALDVNKTLGIVASHVEKVGRS